jgi:hypothetical protein
MPKFKDSIANPQVPPPYRFPNVNSHAFLFDIPSRFVQDYCDRYFNIGDPADRGFIYRPYPLFPYAAFIVLEYPAMIPESEQTPEAGEAPMKDRGYAGQNEFLVVFPVIRHGTTAATFLTDMVLEWASPLVVVNNSTSAISGREILGMDKIYGLVNVAEQSVLAGFMADICLRAAPTTLSDYTTNMMKFVTIQTGPPAPSRGRLPNTTSAWSLLGSRRANNILEGLSATFVGLDEATGGLLPNPMQIVMLKQFRDAADPSQAVYQALVGARCKYSDVTGVQFYNEGDVAIGVRADGPFSALWEPFIGPENSTLQPGVPSWRTLQTKMAVSFTATIDTDDVREMHDFLRPQEASPRRGMRAPWLRPLAGLWGLA